MILSVTGELRINYKARDWCKLPYPGHPHGCPNVGKNPDCPPLVKLVGDVFDLSRPLWMVVVSFDLKSHMARMLASHPHWTERQQRNVLYWQAGVKKLLNLESRSITEVIPGTVYTLLPEAMGVNVIATLRRLGVDVRVRPTDTVYKASLVGFAVAGGN